jgi:hypothetical protein
MRSSLTKPIPLKSNYVDFLGKLFNVILVKEKRPPLQKSAAWLIEPTVAPAHLHLLPYFWQMRPSKQPAPINFVDRARRQAAGISRVLRLQCADGAPAHARRKSLMPLTQALELRAAHKYGAY